ncbi:MAG TPA: GNAT family N-acetyltransferase [Acidimicrobiales bacterium]|nr:GNAT family N-acetyltransferase [Acidimicrobiales bacterium]
MVHPSVRRQGVFSHLFEAAMAELASRHVPRALLVVDRTYASGAGFARAFRATIEHSEHRMTLRREPAAIVHDPLVTARGAEPADALFVLRCLSEAFDLPAEQYDGERLDALVGRDHAMRIIEHAGAPVGTVRVERDGDAAGIYGFAVLPEFQRRGIGRQVLSALARDLPAQGVPNVSLEVSCNNDAALHLYLSCGFDVMGTEDYYAVPVEAPSGP